MTSTDSVLAAVQEITRQAETRQRGVRFIVLALMLAALAIAAAVLFYVVSEVDGRLSSVRILDQQIATKEAELNRRSEAVRQLEAKISDLEQRQVQLADDNARLAKERESREQKLTQLLEATKAAPAAAQTRQVTVAANRASNALYSIGLYAYGSTSVEKLTAATNTLADAGYTIITSTPLESRATWLAARSTVFYYSTEARDRAYEVSRQLGAATGLRFEVARGSGLGIPKGEERTNIRVHLVGE